MASTNMLNTQSANGHVVCQDCLECITCGLCRCGHSRRTDFEHIAHAIRTMKPNSKLFNIVKKEMKLRGRWKDLRGYYDTTKKTTSHRG